jgi:hypothetical protein
MDVSTRHIAAEVAIISGRAETLTGLQSYLHSAGVMTCGATALLAGALPRPQGIFDKARFTATHPELKIEASLVVTADLIAKRAEVVASSRATSPVGPKRAA